MGKGWGKGGKGLEALGGRITRGGPGDDDAGAGGGLADKLAEAAKIRMPVEKFIEQSNAGQKPDAPPKKPKGDREKKAWAAFIKPHVFPLALRAYEPHDGDAFDEALRKYLAERMGRPRDSAISSVRNQLDRRDFDGFDKVARLADQKLTEIGCVLPGGIEPENGSAEAAEVVEPGMTEEELIAGLEGLRADPETPGRFQLDPDAMAKLYGGVSPTSLSVTEGREQPQADVSDDLFVPDEPETARRGDDVEEVLRQLKKIGERRLEADAGLDDIRPSDFERKKAQPVADPGLDDITPDDIKRKDTTPAADPGLDEMSEADIEAALTQLAKKAKTERISTTYERPKDLSAGYSEWPVIINGAEKRLIVSSDGKMQVPKDLKSGDRERLLLIGPFEPYDRTKKYEAPSVESEEEIKDRETRVARAVTFFNERVDEGASPTLMFQIVGNSLPEKDRTLFKETLNGDFDLGDAKIEDQPDFVDLGDDEKEIEKLFGKKEGSISRIPYWKLPNDALVILDRKQLEKGARADKPHLQIIRDGGWHKFPNDSWYINKGGVLVEMSAKEVAAMIHRRQKELEAAQARGEATDEGGWRKKERMRSLKLKKDEIDVALAEIKEREKLEREEARKTGTSKGQDAKTPDTKRASADEREEVGSKEELINMLKRRFGKPVGDMDGTPYWRDKRDPNTFYTYNLDDENVDDPFRYYIRPGGVHMIGEQAYLNKKGRMVEISEDDLELLRERGRKTTREGREERREERTERREIRESREKERTLTEAKDLYWEKRDDDWSIADSMRYAMKGLSERNRERFAEWLIDRNATKGIVESTLKNYEERLAGRRHERGERREDRREEREPQEEKPRSREDRQVTRWQDEVDKYFEE